MKHNAYLRPNHIVPTYSNYAMVEIDLDIALCWLLGLQPCNRGLSACHDHFVCPVRDQQKQQPSSIVPCTRVLWEPALGGMWT